jgi:hypothetical protein
MQYTMKNFIKFTKSNVGLTTKKKPKRDDSWKRERSTARKIKTNMQRGITDYKPKKRIA